MIVLFYRNKNGNLEKVGNLAKTLELISGEIAEGVSKESDFTTWNWVSRPCGLPMAFLAKLPRWAPLSGCRGRQPVTLALLAQEGSSKRNLQRLPNGPSQQMNFFFFHGWNSSSECSLNVALFSGRYQEVMICSQRSKRETQVARGHFRLIPEILGTHEAFLKTSFS